MSVQLDRYSFQHNVDVRQENRRVVDRWFASDLSDRGDIQSMHALFQPYGRVQRNFQPEGRQEFVGDSLRAHHESYADLFSTWSWGDVNILETQYPQVIWALAEGGGTLASNGEEYVNSFAFAFVLEEGKIRVLKEWSNPIPILEARGIKVPEVAGL